MKAVILLALTVGSMGLASANNRYPQLEAANPQLKARFCTAVLNEHFDYNAPRSMISACIKNSDIRVARSRFRGPEYAIVEGMVKIDAQGNTHACKGSLQLSGALVVKECIYFDLF